MSTTSSRQLAKSWPYKRYKTFESELRAAASEWFKKQGIPTHAKMPYYLKSNGDWPKNIICKEVADYLERKKEQNAGKTPFLLHKYLHHGLSSQAMVFNLIGPLVVRNDIGPLKNALNDIGISWPEGEVELCFEYEDRTVFNEDVGQPTSIDLAVKKEEEKGGIFIEAKLAERGFGGCSIFSRGDCDGANPTRDGFSSCYLHHIGHYYLSKLDELGFIDENFSAGPICPLANYYQIFREVAFALSQGGKFVLLLDERNPAFIKASSDYKKTRGLWPLLMKSVPEKHRDNIKDLSIQRVVEAIKSSGRHDDWIADFKNKYGLDKV
ncbi:MAG: hypothetical protein JXA92_05870 [candidate division Zixibacteria bacterium]|nr:hypothetical protein [candidate division Zixibacteria bacterium]